MDTSCIGRDKKDMRNKSYTVENNQSLEKSPQGHDRVLITLDTQNAVGPNVR